MIKEVLAPGSPLLDAAEADLASAPDPPALRGVHRAILAAIAAGERTFSAISRVAGLPSGALSRPLTAVDVVGVTTVSDRARRRSHEVDLLAVRDGRVVAVGEAKLRALGPKAAGVFTPRERRWAPP